MINIFGSGVDGHVRLPVCINKSLHSPGATAQLSGARSTAELIAHYAGLPVTRGELPRERGGGPACNETGNPPPHFILVSYRGLDKVKSRDCSQLVPTWENELTGLVLTHRPAGIKFHPLDERTSPLRGLRRRVQDGSTEKAVFDSP